MFYLYTRYWSYNAYYNVYFKGDLRSTGEIRLFKLGSEASEFGVVFTEDYKEHVRTFTADLSISKVVVGK